MTKTSTGELTSRMAPAGGGTRMPTAKPGSPPRLVMLIGDEPGRRYPLEISPVTIGRSDECEVQLDDSKVSRQHAKITQVENEDWVLSDLGSRNGTLVNGDSVKTHTLRVGDRIQLSHETLLLFTWQDPLEDLLLHRQQMEVIGQLAAGIAHDFNNLLSVISASAEHLMQLPPETACGSTEARECHNDIRSATDQAAELTARLLTIARRRDQESESHHRIDFSKLCEEVLQLVRRTFDRSIELQTDVEPGLLVQGDQGAIHQVLMNLCINARDAMPEGGTLRVAAHKELEPEPSPTSPWMPGPQVVVEVSDTGVGIDDRVLPRVFEPFFTTKEKGAGSGLGLATVYEVATNHGGTAEVRSQVGKGSTFRVCLPALSRSKKITPENIESRQRSAPTWDPESAPSGDGLILVVDDQPLVRRALGRLLKAVGHRVEYANDGAEAVRTYFSLDQRPDAVLMDLDMPKLSGEDALARLLALDPNARVVLVSGYYDDARRKRLLAAGATDFLSKPVDADRLRSSLRLAIQLPRRHSDDPQ